MVTLETRIRKRFNFLKMRYEYILERMEWEIVDYAYGAEASWHFVKVLSKAEQILYGEIQ